jgi:hypothetical protein
MEGSVLVGQQPLVGDADPAPKALRMVALLLPPPVLQEPPFAVGQQPDDAALPLLVLPDLSALLRLPQFAEAPAVPGGG